MTLKSPLLSAVVLALLSAANPAMAEAPPPERLVDVLTSAELEGRLTGSPGARAAASFIVGELERLGISPPPGSEAFTLPFEFEAGAADGGSSLTLVDAAGETSLGGKGDVRALSFSGDRSADGPIVFAGYGLVVPQGRGPGFDSYAGLDVRGKVVLVLRYLPETAEGELRAAMARHAGLRQKALAAAERGAAAFLVVNGPASAGAGKVADLDFDPELAELGIPAAAISGTVVERLLESAGGKSLEQLQQGMDAAGRSASGFELPGLIARLDVRVRREKRSGQNVIGYLPASSPDSETGRQVVLLGAHYDHLGRARHGEAALRKREFGKVLPGADDDVSGVAAVLLAARELVSAQRKHAVVLAFWSGTEQGLIGSGAFLEAVRVAPGDITGYVNLDEVGRARDNRLDVYGVGSSAAWRGLIERANVPVGFDLRVHDEPALGTDATVFHRSRVPAVTFTTGPHEDHHRPSDSADKLNLEELGRVAHLAALLVRKLDGLDARPAFVEFRRPDEKPEDHPEDRRAYTGTIPDYAAEVDGLRLSGVIEGGPAEKAGLAEGDVVVEFAGRPIENIYDYGEALDAVRPGQPIKVVFLRGEERLEVTVTPTTRP